MYTSESTPLPVPEDYREQKPSHEQHYRITKAYIRDREGQRARTVLERGRVEDAEEQRSRAGEVCGHAVSGFQNPVSIRRLISGLLD
ncbi:hypothetical protein AgCh_031117 [Apium graveolens]